MEGYPGMLFSEPRRGIGFVFLGCSLVSLPGWVYYAVVHDGGHTLLFMGIGFALSGCAESLPADRRRSAAVLRVAAIGVMVGLLALLFVAPEIVLG